MTDRIIVATFNNTNSAYDAASAIKNLKDLRRYPVQAKGRGYGQKRRSRKRVAGGGS